MGEWGRYIKARPAEVRKGADAAEEIGEKLHKQVDFARDESRAVASANQGFGAAAELEQALGMWEENWRRLADSVCGVSDKLTKCADRYERADEGAARTFAGIQTQASVEL